MEFTVCEKSVLKPHPPFFGFKQTTTNLRFENVKSKFRGIKNSYFIKIEICDKSRFQMAKKDIFFVTTKHKVNFIETQNILDCSNSP